MKTHLNLNDLQRVISAICTRWYKRFLSMSVIWIITSRTPKELAKSLFENFRMIHSLWRHTILVQLLRENMQSAKWEVPSLSFPIANVSPFTKLTYNSIFVYLSFGEFTVPNWRDIDYLKTSDSFPPHIGSPFCTSEVFREIRVSLRRFARRYLKVL